MCSGTMAQQQVRRFRIRLPQELGLRGFAVRTIYRSARAEASHAAPGLREALVVLGLEHVLELGLVLLEGFYLVF